MTLVMAFLTHDYCLLVSDRLVIQDGKRFENATKQLLIDHRMAIAYAGVADLQRSWEKVGYDAESDTFHRPDYFLWRELGRERNALGSFTEFEHLLQRRWIYEGDFPLAYIATCFGDTTGLMDAPKFLPAICAVSNYLTPNLTPGGIGLFRSGLRVLSPAQPCTMRVFGAAWPDELIHDVLQRLHRLHRDPNRVLEEIIRVYATQAEGGKSNNRLLVSYLPNPAVARRGLDYSSAFADCSAFVFVTDGVPSKVIDEVLIRDGDVNLTLRNVRFEDGA
jgi:hypothetical protein